MKNARSQPSYVPKLRDRFRVERVVAIVLLLWGCDSDVAVPRLETEGEWVPTVTTLRPRLDRPGVTVPPGLDLPDWKHMDDLDRTLPLPPDEEGFFGPPQKPLYPLVSDDDFSTWMKTFEVPFIYNTAFLLSPQPIGRSVSNVKVTSTVLSRPTATGYRTYLVIGGTRYEVANSTGSTITDLTTNPATGNPWRGSDFASMELGIDASGFDIGLPFPSTHQMKCFELKIEVTHEQHPDPMPIPLRDLNPAIR